MEPRRELLMHTFAADPGKSDRRMHIPERIDAETGFRERAKASFFYFDQRAIGSETQCSGAGNTGSEHASDRVLDARTAAGAAAIDPGEQETG